MLKQCISNALNGFLNNITWLCVFFKEEKFEEIVGVKESDNLKVTVIIKREVIK